MWFSESNFFRVRTLSPAGVVTTVAGNGTTGAADGPGAAATFRTLNDLVIDTARGRVLVADNGNAKVRVVDIATRAVSTLAGTGVAGALDGYVATATLNPTSVAVDAEGTVYVSEYANHKIRRIADGIVSTIGGVGGAGTSAGFADGTGTSARFGNPWGITARADGTLYVGDQLNSRIRVMSPSGAWSTLGPPAFYKPCVAMPAASGAVFLTNYQNSNIMLIPASPAGARTTAPGPTSH